MKTMKSLSMALALGFVASTQVFAQETIPNAGSQVRIGGSAPSVCRIASPTALSISNAVLSTRSVNGAQVTISQLANPVNGVALPSQVSLSFAAVCNVAHAMTIRSLSGGLTREEGRVAGSFASALNYNLNARWAGQSVTRSYSGVAGSFAIPVSDGASGILELDIQTLTSPTPLASGRYSEELIVELSAAS